MVDLMEGLQGGQKIPIGDSRERVSQAEYRPVECLQSAEMEAGGREVPATKTPDRCKRDEWSEGGVTSLLDIYESKWLLRNRAKLKGSDWEDIARQVSVRGCGTKPTKTPNQCKNKIESMKKRYRAESAVNNNSVSGSSWQFFGRMDGLLKGNYSSPSKGAVGFDNGVEELGPQALPKVEMDDSEPVQKRVNDASPSCPQEIGKTPNYENIDVEAEGKMRDSNQNDGSNTIPDNRNDSKATDSDISAPRIKTGDAGEINCFKRRKSESSDVADSIRLLGHSILKIEHARMEMFKDSERLRAEAEIRRGEMELKRTEIIAKTQLQIAKLLAKAVHIQNNKSGSSSSRAEPLISKDTEGENG